MKKILFGVAVSVMAFISPQVSASAVEFQCDYKQVASPDGVELIGKFALRFTLDTLTDEAFFVGNNGVANVVPVANNYGITFIEKTDSGNIMTTTINTTDGESVHSRNSIISGGLVPTQYYGTCKISE